MRRQGQLIFLGLVTWRITNGLAQRRLSFYTKTAIFSVELTLISTSFSAGTSYKIVGEVYRASGLQSFAFKCPSCVSAALSNAHWFVRTHFVHATSIVVIGVLGIIDQSILELDKYEHNPKVIENFLKLPNNLITK